MVPMNSDALSTVVALASRCSDHCWIWPACRVTGVSRMGCGMADHATCCHRIIYVIMADDLARVVLPGSPPQLPQASSDWYVSVQAHTTTTTNDKVPSLQRTSRLKGKCTSTTALCFVCSVGSCCFIWEAGHILLLHRCLWPGNARDGWDNCACRARASLGIITDGLCPLVQVGTAQIAP